MSFLSTLEYLLKLWQAKASERMVCHFYRGATWRCQIIDKHLAILAAKHVETRFIKIDAEKCNFLAQRLEIVLMPTIIMTKDTTTHDRLLFTCICVCMCICLCVCLCECVCECVYVRMYLCRLYLFVVFFLFHIFFTAIHFARQQRNWPLDSHVSKTGRLIFLG